MSDRIEIPASARPWWWHDTNEEIQEKEGCQFAAAITWGTFRDGAKTDLYNLGYFIVHAIQAIGHFLALVLFPIGMHLGYRECFVALKYELIDMKNDLKHMLYYTIRAVPVLGYYISRGVDSLAESRSIIHLTEITWGTFWEGVEGDLYNLCYFTINLIQAVGRLLALVIFPIGMHFGYTEVTYALEYDIKCMGENLQNMLYYTIRAVPVVGYYIFEE